MPDTARHFIDWTTPLLPRAAAWLFERAPRDAVGPDLSRTLAVVPGRRAGRLLTGELVDLAESRGVALAPPATLTPRGMLDRLAGPHARAASPIARRLAWTSALRDAGEQEIAALWGRRVESEAERGRFALMLESLSDELAQARLRLDAVGERLEHAPPDEAPRWRAVAALQRRYESILETRGLVDPLLKAMDRVRRGELASDFDQITLIGVTELTPLERGALAASGAAAHALIYAPESLADRFDPFGCIRVEPWSDAEIEIEESRILFAHDPHEESERALANVASLGDPVEATDVVIASPSAETLSLLQRLASEAADASIRLAPGEPVSLTLPGRLLALLAKHAMEASFDTFLALYRRPDVEQAVMAAAPDEPRETWLDTLDDIRQEHVLQRVDESPTGLWPSRAAALRGARAAMETLFGELITRPQRRQSLAAWSDRTRAALLAVYEKSEFQTDEEEGRRTIEALRAIDAALEELSEAGGDVEDAAAGALTLIMERLAKTPIASAPSARAIEGVGWLELLTDPSPHAVVIGMTDDLVPGGRSSDPLLPNSQRAALGLADARSRAARDAYLLTAIARSRDAVFMAPRVTAEGEPARVSRLLLRTSGKPLARRVLRFTKEDLPPAPRLAQRLTLGDHDGYRRTPVVGENYAAPESLAVTDFSVFLRSPAAWYLQRLLRLEDVEAAPRELSPRTFGSLAHEALELYGKDETYHKLTDQGAIAEALSKLLDKVASAHFGPKPPAAVSLQRELLRRRLGFLARHLAERRRKGWRILHVEWKAEEHKQGTLVVDGSPVRLRGKIDLIEGRDDQWEILDFKTSSKPKSPESTHFSKKKGWIDLQLPLYRHVVRSLNPPEVIRVGLAYIPTKEPGPAIYFAEWDAERLAEADEAARDVVRRMRAMAPGAPLEMGDRPPAEGALGFVTGERFTASGDETPEREP